MTGQQPTTPHTASDDFEAVRRLIRLAAVHAIGSPESAMAALRRIEAENARVMADLAGAEYEIIHRIEQYSEENRQRVMAVRAQRTAEAALAESRAHVVQFRAALESMECDCVATTRGGLHFSWCAHAKAQQALAAVPPPLQDRLVAAERLAAARAVEVERLRDALVPRVPPHDGYAEARLCRLCEYWVDDVGHEPSCILAAPAPGQEASHA
jgi:hypothetical protein